MAGLAFAAYFFLGIGPGIVFFLFILAPKSFLVLLTFTSAFYWLLVLFITAAIFRGFVPVPYTVGSYAGMLIGSLVIQEAARYALWRVHLVTTRVLDKHAGATGHRFDTVDKLYVALAWGYGHGAAHVIFFVLSFLPLTVGEGTWYSEACPAMNIFLAGSLYALAFGMLLPSLMVTSFEGYTTGDLKHMALAPTAHTLASLLTLLNFARNGCLASFPLLLVWGAVNVCYAGLVCWRKGAHVQPLRVPVPTHLVEGPASVDDAASDVQLQPESSAPVDGVGRGGAHRRRGNRQAGANWPLVGTDDETWQAQQQGQPAQQPTSAG